MNEIERGREHIRMLKFENEEKEQWKIKKIGREYWNGYEWREDKILDLKTNFFEGVLHLKEKRF